MTATRSARRTGELQLVSLPNGDWVAVRATADQVDALEYEGLWTARGTVRVLSLAQAKREATGA